MTWPGARFIGVFLCTALSVLGCAQTVTKGPPVAPVRPVVDNYYGTRIADPYRYMENLADPAVKSWIRAQGDYAQGVLRSLPERDRLLSRIEELDAGAPYRINVVRRWPNGDLHYTKRLATENLDKLYFRDARTGQERMLIDPEQIGGGSGQHHSLTFIVPSPDGKYIAYGIAAAGSEQTTLHVRDSTTGKDFPDTIDRMEADYTWPYWLPDGDGFVYSRRQKLAADAPPTEGYKKTRAYHHRLFNDPEADALVLGIDSSPMVPLKDVDFPSIVLTPGSRWMIGKIKHGDANELTLYAAPVDAIFRSDPTPWQKICDVADQVEDFTVHEDDIYLKTAVGAPRYRVVRESLAQPDFAKAQTIVGAAATVVSSLSAAKDALYVCLLDAGVEKVARVPYGAGDRPVEILELPAGEVGAFPAVVHSDVDGLFLITSSWTRAGRMYAFDPGNRKLSDTNLIPRGAFDDVPGYESKEVMAASHDGVQVPLSIIYKRGIKLDGSHPMLVSGYGGYGATNDIYYDPTRLAWLERGGVIAVAHVRGGGEFGKEWHHAGRLATKPNTWKDFIACCEYLVHEGYTSPAKLAGQGGSAGGILIGRAITERPDLFAAALVQVGCTDMLRMETTTNGVPNIPEFGTVTTKEGFDGLYAMSAYAHIKDGTHYPAVLLTHGINDPRVEPWMSAKLTARLQAATASGRPILFRVDYDAGHGIGSTRKQREEERADSWAFLLWQMGN